jgi:SAM dependent carboxyl methyltransferase
MSEHVHISPGVMEGKGAYNKHAALPAGGATLALPFLEEAVRNVAIDVSDRPIIIADYGSSQGKNSLGPMKLALKNLRPRIVPSRPIVVVHIDQPTNDFNSLFEVLATDPDRYALDEPNVFPCAIGRSFYERVLPPDSVHLGWCSYAAVWLSRIPTLIPGHFISLRSTDTVRAEFERQAAHDWMEFLELRASELLPGGRLVVVLPALADDGSSGFEGIMDHANAVLAEMVEEGVIAADELARMILGSHPRRNCDLLAPFDQDEPFQQLTVERFDMSVVTDIPWTEYERDRDREALATKHALFFRCIFMPSLAAALDCVRAGDAEALGAFADRLEHGLKRRLASQPAAMHSFVQTIVLAKQGLA